MRSWIASNLNHAAEEIEEVLRPFSKGERAWILQIAGIMLDSEDAERIRAQAELGQVKGLEPMADRGF